MLAKLVKYDLKYGIKLFVILHSIMLITAIAGRFLFLEKINFNGDTNMVASSLVLFISIAILLYTSLSMGTYLLIALRFYQNLFSSEGYLTWTLPATPTQHLWSKIISGTIWLGGNLVSTALSLIILVSGKNVMVAYAEVAPEFVQTFGMDPIRYGCYIFGISLFCLTGSVIMIYFSITLGQLFPAHRILTSIIMYCITTLVMEGLILAIMFTTNLFPEATSFLTSSNGNMTAYLFALLKISIFFTVIISAIEYFIMHYILHHKINLI